MLRSILVVLTLLASAALPAAQGPFADLDPKAIAVRLPQDL
jgi:hypothetical protein